MCRDNATLYMSGSSLGLNDSFDEAGNVSSTNSNVFPLGPGLSYSDAYLAGIDAVSANGTIRSGIRPAGLQPLAAAFARLMLMTFEAPWSPYSHLN